MKFERLGNLVSITKGRKLAPAPKKEGQNFRYIQIEDLRNDSNLKYTNEKGVEVHENDLIIAWDGANAGTVGYGLRGMIGSTLARLRIKEEKNFNTAFIGIFLKMNFSYLRAKATGATIPHIDRGTLVSLKIPVLDYPEQHDIANVLSKSEDLISRRQEGIILLDKLVEAIFFEMFGNLKNIKTQEFTLDELKSGGNHTFSNGPFGSDLLTSELKDEGVPVIYIRDLRNGVYRWKSNVYVTNDKAKSLPNCQVLSGDVLIAKVGDPPGISAVYPNNSKMGIITQDVIRIRLNHKIVKPQFFSYLINSDLGKNAIKRISIEGTRNRFSLRDFKRLKVIIPDIEHQNEFVQIVANTENLKVYYRQGLFELEKLSKSLSQQAFKGELDFSKSLHNKTGASVEHLKLTEATLGNIDERKEVLGIRESDGEVKRRAEENVDFSFESKLPLIDAFDMNSEGLCTFIDNFFSTTYFTFDSLRQATSKAGWHYEFEEVKNFVFELLRGGSLRQVFADAAFKTQFTDQHPDYETVKNLSERMYLQRVAP